MKVLFRVIIFSFLIFLNIKGAFAQETSILGNFSATESNGKVFLNWQIIAGSTCNGIQIYRSTDSIHFVQIWDIQGVCGNISEAENFDFTDNNPLKNRINYYRLELGNTGFSNVLSIEVVDVQNDGYQVRPNPISSEFKIYFDNYTHSEQHLNIFTLSGVHVFTSYTTEDYFQLDGATLISGVYLFTVSGAEALPTVQGKFVVQH